MAIVPLVDMTNHVNSGATATVESSSEGGSVREYGFEHDNCMDRGALANVVSGRGWVSMANHVKSGAAATVMSSSEVASECNECQSEWLVGYHSREEGRCCLR